MSEFRDFSNDPIKELKKWYEHARDSYLEAGAKKRFDSATLCTVTKEGGATGRIILLKEIDEKYCYFYTNYDSIKSIELENNPKAALVIHWGLLGRQVRIEGLVKKTSPQKSRTYFHSRYRNSQIGAHASDQSKELGSRQELLERIDQFTKKFEGKEVPLPSNWGGFYLEPSLIEFWIDGEFRIHDRLQYQKASGSWTSRLLNP